MAARTETTTPPNVTAFGVTGVCDSHRTAGRHSRRLKDEWIPSETFPERATRKRSAATAVSSEVTAMPSGRGFGCGWKIRPKATVLFEAHVGTAQLVGA